MQAFRAGSPSTPGTGTRTGPAVAQLAGEKTEVRRGSASAARAIGSHRRTSGGLSGQYSTSMPATGGYFPEDAALEEDPDDEEAHRRRAREDKHRALQAAWGIDTRK